MLNLEAMFKKFDLKLDDIKESLQQPEFIDEVANKFSEKIINKNSEEETFNILQEYFGETDDEKMYCKYCFEFSSSKLMPQDLKKGLKGNFGVFLKPDSINYKKNKMRKKGMADHCRSDIHHWCVTEHMKQNVEDTEFLNKNQKGAEILVTSAIECLLEGDGSKKFVRLNDLLQSLLTDDFPTKNDGRQMYYEIREMFVEKILSATRKLFETIKTACFSLDKVTVRRTSFMVIMSFFFCEGKICPLLNSLHKMKEDEYDGKGSAKMVGEALMGSLDMPKSKVKTTYNAGSYDGVFAPKAERVEGGGSLNLMEWFGRWCNDLEDDDHSPQAKALLKQYTGGWDAGHKLQLVYENAIKKSNSVKTFLKALEKVMKRSHGKDGIIFQNVAIDMKAAFLSDKSEQATRWVKALLRIVLAFLRNLPVVYKLLQTAAEEARVDNHFTEQKAILKELHDVSHPEILAFGFGFGQILDHYAEVSLNVQRLWNFPTSVCIDVQNLREKLNDLKQNFKFSDK